MAEGDVMDDSASHAKRIHDAKCQKADLKNACQSQTKLTVEQQGQLEVPLKCEPLFNGQLGHWEGQESNLHLRKERNHAICVPVTFHDVTCRH